MGSRGTKSSQVRLRGYNRVQVGQGSIRSSVRKAG